ncbi:MAG: single-stranded DNA-binding protein, partial [Solirubrobacterales bacterium]|nr:single-stranded DNA-binding protein [Solirubrobacterales bacterium]
MNTVNLIGRLTRDPELRSLPSGQAVCDMRIAVDNGKSRTGVDRDPTFVDV